jgi:flagellar biosynthesis/type III secretory pathway protein FliH
MTWDRGKEAHLALRAIRNEMQKLVNCLDGAIAKYEQMERIEEEDRESLEDKAAYDDGYDAGYEHGWEVGWEIGYEHATLNHLLRDDPNGQARPVESQLDAWVCGVCGEPLPVHFPHRCRSTEQLPQSD